MIKEYSQKEAIDSMNKFGQNQRPFLFMLDFKAQKNVIIPLDILDNQAIKAIFHQKDNRAAPTPLILKKFPISFSEYEKGFNIVRENLLLGNSFLVNYTCQTPIEMNLSLAKVFEISIAKYKVLWQDKFVCFSPETFVQIDENGTISCRPMKGTIDANIKNAENLILEDKKELYEHVTIVDLIRNDISRIAHKVWVEKFRYIESIKKFDGGKILQVSSDIRGLLDINWKKHLGDLLFSLLPAGSISGAPKDSTLQIIDTAENYARNYYTGIVGIFDGKTLDTGVMIRFIEQTPTGLIFKSGGGITARSDAGKEYQEMIQKIYVPTI